MEVGEWLRTAAVPCYLGKSRRKNIEGQMNSLRAKRNIPYVMIDSCVAEDLQPLRGNSRSSEVNRHRR